MTPVAIAQVKRGRLGLIGGFREEKGSDSVGNQGVHDIVLAVCVLRGKSWM
jgi:hypothetical protein